MDKLYAGVFVKGINATLAEEYSANAFALDVGLYTKISSFGIGASFQNLGTKMKFIDEAESLPVTYRLGGSYSKELSDFIGVTAGIDGVKVLDEDLAYHLGGSLLLAKHIVVRGGYKINGENSFSMGLSTRWNRIEIDYSCAVQDVFDETHLIGMTVYMGKINE
ncbi:MAG: hypothetical protein GF384_05545 [Elusimicrobia bacterium]|nr:hypothetical protein [Elusimicrobiota bacterium]